MFNQSNSFDLLPTPCSMFQNLVEDADDNYENILSIVEYRLSLAGIDEGDEIALYMDGDVDYPCLPAVFDALDNLGIHAVLFLKGANGFYNEEYMFNSIITGLERIKCG